MPVNCAAYRAGRQIAEIDLKQADCIWRILARVTRFGDEPSRIVEGVIREWHASGHDPEHNDIWFALPGFMESECRANDAVRSGQD